MSGRAIFFSGSIGAGKTSLGRAVAAELGAAFIDGDDYADQTKPWYSSTLSTSRRIAAAAISAVARRSTVVVAYPLRCVNFVYYRRRMVDAGIGVTFVTLRASYESILDARRGRVFDPGERERIAEMIAEGYGDRPLSDLIVDTDAAGFEETVAALVARLRPLVA